MICSRYKLKALLLLLLVLLFDLSAAFDIIDFALLLFPLDSPLGFCATPSLFLAVQKEKLMMVQDHWPLTTSQDFWVRQGCVTGPILFILDPRLYSQLFKKKNVNDTQLFKSLHSRFPECCSLLKQTPQMLKTIACFIIT